jgi:Kef-type K+ transport system membrane component KefB
MRRLFVVAVLLAMMLGLTALQAETRGDTDPLTLATIGFVVLAAFAIAELGAAIGLPKVTGYILAGIALGPFASNIMSSNVVGEMRMFNTLALGLIATTAGLEIDLGGLRRLAKTLAATTMIKIVLGIVLVGGTVYALESRYGFLALEGQAAILGVAAVFAAISIGTSPSISLAIISEFKAKGRLSDLVLGAAVVKDVVVVVCLAIAVGIAQALTSGGELGADVLVHEGKKLGATILAGGILGALLIVYLRFIRAEMLLFVAAMILVVAEVSEALHLELLLVFIVAGLVVRNVSSHQLDLLHPLEAVSLPVFIVFFTNAGANVDLQATWSVLPLAAAACLARVVVYIVASSVGGRIGGEPPAPRRLAWLAYLPQAGVSLGLIGLAGEQLVDSIGAQVATLGMAVVAINLLVGPITMRLALRSAGEIATDAEAGTETEDTAESVPPHAAAVELEDPGLAELVSQGIADAQRIVETWMVDVAEPRITGFAARLTESLAKADDAGRVRRALVELRPLADERRETHAAALFASLAAECRVLPDERRVPLEHRHRAVQREDSSLTRWRKRLTAVGAALTFRTNKRKRTVPVRLAARTHLEPRFVEIAERAQNSLLRFEVPLLDTLRACGVGEIARSEALRAIEDRAMRTVVEIRRSTSERLERAFTTLADVLARVDTPQLPIRSIRYSAVDREVREALSRIDVDGSAWPGVLGSLFESVILTATLAASRQQTRDALETRVVSNLEAAFVATSQTAAILDRRIGELAEKLAELDRERIELELRALLPKPAAKELRAAQTAVRRIPPAARLIEPFLPDVPERMRLCPSLGDLKSADRPAQGVFVDTVIRERVQARILEALQEPLAELLESSRTQLDEDDKIIADALGLLDFLGRGVVQATEDDEEARKALADGLTAARGRLAPIPTSGVDKAQEIRNAVAEAINASYGSLAALWSSRAAGTARYAPVLAKSALADAKRELSGVVSRAWQRLVVLVRGEAARYVERRRLREAAGNFDPADMREFLVERTRERSTSDGPAVYEQLFATQPLRDPVLFAGWRTELDALVRAERTWRADPTAGNAVLVIGTSGSGKSSMLEVGRMKVGRRRTVHVQRREAGSDDALLAVLGRHLGCEPTPDAIVADLADERTMMAIDDLHTWIDTSDDGLELLEQLLSIIDRTGSSTFWLLAMDRHAFELLDEVAPLRGWFAQLLFLGPLSDRALAEVIALRHRPTAMTVTYPDPGFASRMRRHAPEGSYYTALARRAHGNLRLAITLWRAAAAEEDGKVVHVRPLGSESAGLPFLPSLDLDALAVLNMLKRSGPMTVLRLSRSLGADAGRPAHLLATAGLVRQREGEYELVPEQRDDVEAALVGAGVIAVEGAR